jgi:hypothetical protein
MGQEKTPPMRHSGSLLAQRESENENKPLLHDNHILVVDPWELALSA